MTVQYRALTVQLFRFSRLVFPKLWYFGFSRHVGKVNENQPVGSGCFLTISHSTAFGTARAAGSQRKYV